MTIRKIARMGHPVLRQQAKPVDDPLDPEIQRLVRDMIETMIDANGAGLAAPQVYESLRLVIFQAPPERVEPGSEMDEAEVYTHSAPLTILFNPVIEVLGPETQAGWEGCLSVPGLRGLVSRHNYIRYSGLDQAGKPISRIARGFHARVVQHECDHLDGILYPQRMQDLSLLLFETEIRHFLEAQKGSEEA
ncbi:MAG: peptide deformylase [Pseudomonadota bacterium]